MSKPVAKSAIIEIIFKWWCAGCPKLPESDYELQHLAEYTNLKWVRNRAHIMECVNYILPELQKTHHKLMLRRIKDDERQEKALVGLMAWHAKRIAAKGQKNVVSGYHKVQLADDRSTPIDVNLPRTLPTTPQKRPKTKGASSLVDK